MAIQSIGPRVSQLVFYNDASNGMTPAMILSVNSDGTVNLAVLAWNASKAEVLSVEYDNTQAATGRWSYMDPPVSDARSIGPKTGQIVQYNDVTSGLIMGMIGSVNSDGTVNMRVYPPLVGDGTAIASAPYDYRGTVTGTWRYYDPPPNRALGPAQGQIVLFNSAAGLGGAFVLSVNATNGRIALVLWQTSGLSGLRSNVRYDQTQQVAGAWSYADPAVN